MKALIWLVLILAIVGGGGFGLYKAGKLPFLPLPKAAKKAPAGKTAVAPAPASAEVSKITRPPAKPVAKAPRPDPEAAAQAEKRMTRLVALYEGMSSEEAKPIVDKLPDPLVTDLLRRMDEKQAAKILVGMKPERAVKLTNALAKGPAAGGAASR